MNRLIRLAARLYPQAWRARYGAEFAALLEETGGGGRALLDVCTGAIVMHIRARKKAGTVALLALAALGAATWLAGRTAWVSPGTHLVIRQDSDLGAVIGFLIVVAAILGVGIAIALKVSGQSREAGQVLRVSAAGLGLYCAAVTAISLVTPRTIVSIGDSYCYDLWCIGVQQVTATRQGPGVLYTAQVRLFSDANHVTTNRGQNSLYALDETGRRFSLDQDQSAIPLSVTLKPGQSVNTSIAFRAPAGAGRLYLTADYPVPPWVPLYLGSDLSPFHRRTLLTVF